jgi:hypothetical protein
MLADYTLGRISRGLIWVLLGAALIEVGAAAGFWLLVGPLHAARFVWNPNPEEAGDNWSAFSGSIDEDIGGPSMFSEASGAARDPTGAKRNSDFPDTQACGAAYGESLVLGYEIPPRLGWVEQLSRLIGCRIANYAVNGNSTDQSYVRFTKENSEVPFVLLGIDVSTIANNITQYSGLITGQPSPYALKGRFALDDADRLQWLDRPWIDGDGFVALHQVPAQILPNDYFLPDTADGPVTVGFTYSSTLFRLARLSRFQNILARRAEWANFYAPDHPSGALRLLVAICDAFVRHGDSWGSRVLVIPLPVAQSFRQRSAYGKFEYAPLVDTLRAKGLEVFDPGPAMLGSLAGRPYCDLFTQAASCSGHYSVFANTILARLVDGELRQRGFVRR